MTELNEYEYELLDVVLEAFGAEGSLTRRQLLELFGGDEASAIATVRVLIEKGLVAGPGKPGFAELPGKLTLNANTGQFIKEGGFSKQYQAEQQKPVAAPGLLAKLQQQNMRLQTEKLAKDAEIKNLQKKVNGLQGRMYIYYFLIAIAVISGFFIGRAFGGGACHDASVQGKSKKSVLTLSGYLVYPSVQNFRPDLVVL